MKKEEVISSFIMFIVSGLVLVGFTIAWYSNMNMPAVTGIELQAVEIGHVKVALEPGGKDVSELEGDAKYADMGIRKFSNLDLKELAPGAYGQVTFYVTPINSGVRTCFIVPEVKITQTQDGSSWYPDNSVESSGDEGSGTGAGSGEENGAGTGSGEESGTGAGSGEESGAGTGSTEITIAELYEIAGRHIHFFSDKEMTNEITPDAPYQLTWTSKDWTTEDGVIEKQAVIYWKWYYEYPLSEEEEAFPAAEQKALLRQYDEEDMILGNFISYMKFYFTFAAQ